MKRVRVSILVAFIASVFAVSAIEVLMDSKSTDANLETSSQAHVPTHDPAIGVYRQTYTNGTMSGTTVPPFFKDGSYELPPEVAAVWYQQSLSSDDASRGDVAAWNGDWQLAVSHYKEALARDPDNFVALYGMGRYADITGDTDKAIQYYRMCVYKNHTSSDSADINDSYRENRCDRLMEYVLLLDKVGQMDEALAVYRHGAHLNNYERDPNTRMQTEVVRTEVALPEFGPGEWAYTPQRLRAMAHLALGSHGHESGQARLSHLQEAVRLAPDSAAAYYYLGKWLWGRPVRGSQDAKTALEKAVQLGDDRTAKAANVYLTVFR